MRCLSPSESASWFEISSSSLLSACLYEISAPMLLKSNILSRNSEPNCGMIELLAGAPRISSTHHIKFGVIRIGGFDILLLEL